MCLLYKARIDLQLQDNLVFMDKFKAITSNISVEKLKDGHTESFVTAIIERRGVLYDPLLIYKALKKIHVPMQINFADSRVNQLCSQYFSWLKAVGYGKCWKIRSRL